MFYIRADANEIIGTGHVMRCLSIAEEMRKQGEEVTFIIADERTKDMIIDKEFQVICLDSVWNDLNQEIDKMIHVIKKYNIPRLLIDSYFVTEYYLETIRKHTKIVYINDLNQFPYPVDYLINYNIYAKEIEYEKRYQAAGMTNTRFLLGCSYAPLRSEFLNISHPINDKVAKVLITSGGTDNYNIVKNILQSLSKQMWFSKLEYYVVLGRFYSQKEKLEEKWGNCPNIHLLSNVNNMADYMKLCDVAITAGGVTTYELCACGVPAIMYTLADNQLQIVDAVSRQGVAVYVGDVRENISSCMERLVFALEELLDNPQKKGEISVAMQKIVDGKGCKRLAEYLRIL